MWVIFEGLDKAGMGTLERAFLEATGFKHMVIDRGPAGYLTFDKLFDRVSSERTEDFAYHARKIMESNDFMIVFCFVDDLVAAERLKAHNETCPYDYAEAQTLYAYNVYRFYDYCKVLELDTTNRTVDECVQMIIKKLEEV